MLADISVGLVDACLLSVIIVSLPLHCLVVLEWAIRSIEWAAGRPRRRDGGLLRTLLDGKSAAGRAYAAITSTKSRPLVIDPHFGSKFTKIAVAAGVTIYAALFAAYIVTEWSSGKSPIASAEWLIKDIGLGLMEACAVFGAFAVVFLFCVMVIGWAVGAIERLSGNRSKAVSPVNELLFGKSHERTSQTSQSFKRSMRALPSKIVFEKPETRFRFPVLEVPVGGVLEPALATAESSILKERNMTFELLRSQW